MEDISRIASPMSLCEEDLFDTSHKVERRKKQLQDLQKVRPASFLIGSIQKVNERICSLDSELSLYESKLAIESRSSNQDEIYDPNLGTLQRSVSCRSTRSAKDREDREARRFAGAFSQESVQLLVMKTPKRKGPAQKSDAPRLVELQQFPGYYSSRLTPLPHGLAATDVLDRVTNAQNFKAKSAYSEKVKKMLYSRMQRSVLQDAFWWFFLNKYHPDKENQSKLFKRIARNYVALFLMATEPKFRNDFFMTYPNLMSQAIYSAFCVAFPQSWRQFDEASFKETLIATTTTWVSGIKPTPRLYASWNYNELEPAKMRREESMMSNPKEIRSISPDKVSSIDSAASTKASSIHSRSASYRGVYRTTRTRSDVHSSVSSQKTRSRDVTDKGILSPIIEVRDGSVIDSDHSKILTSTRKLQSCPMGRAAEFERCAFNLYGRSPLLCEYLNAKGLERKTGYNHLIRRTQIETLPSVDAPTFSDLLTDVSKSTQDASSQFNDIRIKNEKANLEFDSKMKEEHRKYHLKASKLLSKPRQVHYLSNLLLMEMKRDDELESVGAAAALQAAMAAESAH